MCLRAICATFVMLLLAVPPSSADETKPRSDDRQLLEEQYRRDVLPILRDYCYGCHADGADEGDFSLDEFPSVESLTTDTQTWWSVLQNVRSDVMPPVGEDQPTEAEKQLLFEWITGRVFASSHDPSDPGKSPLRRLNRLEYGNTIRDLMGIEFDTSVEFPPDDSGDGFDNNADALSISPLLAEKYIEAARTIVDRAVPTTSRVIPLQLIQADSFRGDGISKAKHLSFEKPASISGQFKVDRDASYRLTVPIEINGSFDFNPARARVQLLLDDEVLHDREYGWKSEFVDEITVLRELNRGEHSIQLNVQPVKSKAVDAGQSDRTFVKLRIPASRLEGPQDPALWNKPTGYDRFFHLDQPPVRAAERRDYAAEVLRRFCLRAFRRPVGDDYLSRLLEMAGFPESTKGITTDPAADSPTFEQRIARAFTVVLASPRFLFRVEKPQADPDEVFPEVDDYSLASRLSYFLWSTMPDDELLELAGRGELQGRLASQVERMLRDDRSDRLIKNFVGQWLQVRDVESVSIDPLAALGVRQEYEQLREYLESTESGRGRPPSDASQEHQDAYRRYREIRDMRNRLDGEVRRDMRRETERLFSYILRENRPLIELLDSDYAFLNERLAKHYGVPGVKGGDLRKVELPADSPLGGVLTQGTFLLVTSNPTRTSPVKRGLFILDNILGTPSPPAPPLVPELEESADESKMDQPTVRQLLEIHRQEPLCHSCHARFDPLGLAFENFTAIGTWRDQEHGKVIEPAGSLISGESFDDVSELKRLLAGPRRSDFYRCLTERMLSYAIGRSLDFGDEAELEKIRQELENHKGQAERLIHAVVNTVAFRRIRRPEFAARRPDTSNHEDSDEPAR